MNLRAFGIAVCVALAPAVSLAQEYPSKPIRLIAPFPPGGTTDVLCRYVAQKLGDGLGRQVVVENRPGAGGNIGHEAAAKSPPDGYTLVISATGAMVANQFLYKRLGFDPLHDFSPISVIATSGPVLVVHPSVPARTVKELIAVAKARPNQLNVGSGPRARGDERAALPHPPRPADDRRGRPQPSVPADLVGAQLAPRHARGHRQPPQQRSRADDEAAGSPGALRVARHLHPAHHARAGLRAHEARGAGDGEGDE